MSRTHALRRVLSTKGVDALYLSFLPDIRWASGFTGSNGILIVRPDASHFITDGRYADQAEKEVSGASVHAPGYDLIGHVAEAGLLKAGMQVLYQSDHVTVAGLSELESRLEGVVWTGEPDLLVRQIASKSEAEIARIEAAQQLTDDVFGYLCGWIRPGMTEKEVAAEVIYQHLQRGAGKMSFDPIVASGPNSALPHARPTDRRLREGEIVLLDFGCFLDGYASDMTRAISLGPPDSDVQDVYDLVLAAQQEAILHARAGMKANEVDDLARRVIREGGFAESFSHGLGHGVGLQIHEWPRVSYSVEYALPENAVVSIEPGIYLPGRFGVRIEDLVVLRADGCQNLTTSSKELVAL